MQALREVGFSLRGDFISIEEERELLAAIDAQPWNNDLKRRTQHYGWRYDYSKRSGSSEYLGPLPLFLEQYAVRVGKVCGRQFEQCIVNEYLPGQGISAHTDLVAAYGDHVCSLSLGSSCIMNLHDPEKKMHELDLPRRSLLVMHGDARYKWKHSIAARKSDKGVPRGRRVSVTFRFLNKSATEGKKREATAAASDSSGSKSRESAASASSASKRKRGINE